MCNIIGASHVYRKSSLCTMLAAILTYCQTREEVVLLQKTVLISDLLVETISSKYRYLL